MSHALSPTTRPARCLTRGSRLHRAAATALLVAAVFALSAAAQHRPASGLPFHATSAGGTLWLAEIGADQTHLYVRDLGHKFDVSAAPLDGRAVMLAADADHLYAFFDDSSFYSFTADARAGRVELMLPSRALPWDLLVSDETLYALVDAAAATAMRAKDSGAGAAVDDTDDHLWLARYDHARWTAVARTAAPHPTSSASGGSPVSEHRLRPRLTAMAGRLWVFWLATDSHRLLYQAIDTEGGTSGQSADAPIQATIPLGDPVSLRAFWALSVNRFSLLLVARADLPGEEQLTCYRAADESALSAGKWEQTEPWQRAADATDNTAANLTAARYVDAFEFNQHLGLLAVDTQERSYLRFERFDTAPSEPGGLIAPLLARANERSLLGPLLNMVVFVVLLSLIGGVFLFRRGALVEPVALPPHLAIARHGQRLLAAAIDLLPFAAITARLLGLGVGEAFSGALGWAMGSDLANDGMPAREILIWWLYFAASYCLYCLIMELATGRTVGKVLARLRVSTEQGIAPGRWQLALRNLLRFLELVPPLWALTALVVLTPKRQRLGDLFARTLVVRQAAPLEEPADTDSEDRE